MALSDPLTRLWSGVTFQIGNLSEIHLIGHEWKKEHLTVDKDEITSLFLKFVRFCRDVCNPLSSPFQNLHYILGLVYRYSS